MIQQTSAPFQSASLYVGDLHNEVTESVLFEQFNRVGPVASIRVCRDSVSRRSLGYAYVNFHNVQDAERALDTMNFTEIKTRPCRIMWSQRDPSLRKSGVGNVFVRNLAPSVDNKGLYDTFSVFGNILSWKVATDDKGVSKGYGYVHFETAESAQDAIQKFNGTLIDEVEVQVGIFVRKQDRAGQADWTNLYVKQFPASWDENKLKEVFSVFGVVANVAVNRDGDKLKGFGFVNFADHESAVRALADLANKTFEDADGSFELYVSRAQKKTERSREIKSRIDALNNERVSKYHGMNLYVKNISDTVTDESFKESFLPFGTISSARIMRDEAKVSKGFGFICYSSAEEANRAVNEMNGKVIGNKPIVVTLHQRREVRKAQLAATYAPNMRGGFPQGGMTQGGMQMAPMFHHGGMYLPPGQQGFPHQGNPRGPPMQYGFPGHPMGGRGGGMQPRGIPYGGRGGAPGYFPGNNMPPYIQQGVPPSFLQQQPGRLPENNPYNQVPNQGMLSRPQNMQQPQSQMIQQHNGNRRNSPQQPNRVQGPGNFGPPQVKNVLYPQVPQQLPQQARTSLKFSNQARNQNGQQVVSGLPGVVGVPQNANPQQIQAQQPVKNDFSDLSLASADPLTQKNMIGEHLYPLIYRHQPEQAGKITGMLLEMDNGELLNLIESPDALLSKIEEALNVLRIHKAEE